MACRVYSLQAIEAYKPPTLAGHRDVPVAVAFAGDARFESVVLLCSLSWLPASCCGVSQAICVLTGKQHIPGSRVHLLGSCWTGPSLAADQAAEKGGVAAGGSMRKAASATGQQPPALITVSRDGAVFYWMLDKPAEEAAAAAPVQPSGSAHASQSTATRKRTHDGEEDDAAVAIAGRPHPGKRRKGSAGAADTSDVHDVLPEQSRTYAGGCLHTYLVQHCSHS